MKITEPMEFFVDDRLGHMAFNFHAMAILIGNLVFACGAVLEI